MQFIESLTSRVTIREDDLRREKMKIDNLIEKNSKVVLKLVNSYFEELRELWVQNYQKSIQETVIGTLTTHVKKARQKLSKIRKISESFVNGDFEEDLLTYGLEKNIQETIHHIENLTAEIEEIEKKGVPSVCCYSSLGQHHT